MSESAKNVYSQVFIHLFLAEPAFLKIISDSELTKHLASGGSSSVTNNDHN